MIITKLYYRNKPLFVPLLIIFSSRLTGVVAAVVAAAAWFAQAWFGATPGIVYKCDPVYDFIVVGGGTAGSVMAARLSETPHHRILLLEAGGEEPWLSSIPLAAPLLQGSRYDWQYMTASQKTSSEALVDKVRVFNSTNERPQQLMIIRITKGMD